MDNAYYLYEAMNEFRKAQIANRETYLNKKQGLDRYKGSVAYDEELKQFQEERSQANAAARAACKAKIDPIFKAMHETNAKRGITAPSEEAIRILTAVKMLKKPSKPFLDCVANSLGGNALALAVLSEIARDAWKDELLIENRVVPDYSSRAANELNPDGAAEAINSLQRTCNEIINGSGANRGREMWAKRNQQINGGQFDPDEFPQEPAYESEKDFYTRELPWTNYDSFVAAVN